MSSIDIILLAVGLYALLGVLFALAFVIGGIGRVDPAAAASPKSVRVLLFPGVAGLWPIMLAKWMSARSTPVAGRSTKEESS